MSSLIIVFIFGYILHFCYKALDFGISKLIKNRKDDLDV